MIKNGRDDERDFGSQRFDHPSDRSHGDFSRRSRERGGYGREAQDRYENIGSDRAWLELNRGTIFDRGQRERGNYDLSNRSEFRRSYDRGRYGNWEETSGRQGYGDRSPNRRGRSFSDDWEYDYDEPTYWVYEEWWLVPGPFTGVGPKGYRRSDNRICEEVCERISQHGRVDASEIEVDVNDGEVTLKGTVENRHTKRLVEEVADTVSGVTDIHNQMRVREQVRTLNQEQMDR